MDWTQTVTLGATLIAYMTGMCIFFYRLNEKTIREWREEHTKQIEKTREDMNKNESHWRELFMYINNKIDEVKKPS